MFRHCFAISIFLLGIQSATVQAQPVIPFGPSFPTGPSGLYPGMPGVYPGMPGVSSLYPGMPGVSSLYPGMPGVGSMYPGMPGVGSMYPGMPGVGSMYPGMPGVGSMYPGMPGVGSMYPGMPGVGSMYPGMPGVGSMYPGMPGVGSMYPGMPGVGSMYPGMPGVGSMYPGMPGANSMYPGMPGMYPAGMPNMPGMLASQNKTGSTGMNYSVGIGPFRLGGYSNSNTVTYIPMPMGNMGGGSMMPDMNSAMMQSMVMGGVIPGTGAGGNFSSTQSGIGPFTRSTTTTGSIPPPIDFSGVDLDAAAGAARLQQYSQ